MKISNTEVVGQVSKTVTVEFDPPEFDDLVETLRRLGFNIEDLAEVKVVTKIEEPLEGKQITVEEMERILDAIKQPKIDAGKWCKPPYIAGDQILPKIDAGKWAKQPTIGDGGLYPWWENPIVCATNNRAL